MKKFYIFITLILTLFSLPIINVTAQTTYIRVGLSTSLNVDSIYIENNSIIVGYGSGNEFIQNASISSNSGFEFKYLNGYFTKLGLSFSTYEEAIQYSKNLDNFFPLFDGKSWNLYTEYLGDIQQNNSVSGQIIILQDIIGIYSGNQLLAAYSDSLKIKDPTNYLSLNGNLYRNIIQINISAKKLCAINILDIEEYLYGVVPSEMPASWHIEALKAQAVAARNYAYSNLGTYSNLGFDVYDTVASQVYTGVAAEQASTNQAVDSTRGIFAYYKDEIISAFYYSSNGGYSDNSENVWSTAVPYLRAIKDDFEVGAKVWQRSFSFSELSSLASNIGTVNEVILERDSLTGRAISLTLIGSSGQKVLTKEDIRTFFSSTSGGSLESRNFTILEADSNYSSSTQSSIYAVGKDGVYQLDPKNSYTISASNQISQGNLFNAIDKDGRIGSITDLSNNTSSDNYSNSNNSGNLLSVKSSSSSVVTFSGKGWGHGVGMSQYGAKSLAENGYTFDQILKYYYTGIDVK